MSLIQDIIATKRDGGALAENQITHMVAAISDGTANDAQLGAFAMAVLLNGMTGGERVALTRAMRDSGATLEWDLPGPVVDKHSTGGVSDCVSLIVGPALAACGAFVPMISGRGLGHTGGTLDKFDAIPGYRTDADIERFRRVVRETGCAIIGQTADLAPADKRLYAIRDVSGTVDSIDLICASILSKKLAEGLDALVLDIKCGNGAVARDEAKARALAGALVEVANGAGCPTRAVITDMNEPLCSAAGNALEVAACVALLRGDEVDARLWDVSVELGATVLAQTGLAGGIGEGRAAISGALTDGRAAEVFAAMVTGLGGPPDLLDRAEAHLAHAPVVEEIYPERAGFVGTIDTRALGRAVVELGGGRRNPDDALDYSVGLDWLAGIGRHVDAQTPVARIHARTPQDAATIGADVRAAFAISETVPPEAPLIIDTVGP